jgi:hypothetical protein
VILKNVGKPDPWHQECTVILDREGDMHTAYGADAACLYLLRPDGYVGLRCRPPATSPIVDYLNRVFQPGVSSPHQDTDILVGDRATN